MQCIRLLIQKDGWINEPRNTTLQVVCRMRTSFCGFDSSAMNHKKWIQWIGAGFCCWHTSKAALPEPLLARESKVDPVVLANLAKFNLQNSIKIVFRVLLICINGPCPCSPFSFCVSSCILKKTCWKPLSHLQAFIHFHTTWCLLDIRPRGASLGLGWIQQSQAVEVPVAWSKQFNDFP